jgi:predicted kinase
MIVLMNGLPGSGKSTMALALAESLGAIYLSTDEVRKRLFREIRYDNIYKELVYNIIALFIEKMATGIPVVVDGTFSKNVYREIFEDLGKSLRRKVLYIHCHCEERVCIERIRKRKAGYSDADEEVFRIIQKEWEEYRDNIPVNYINTEDDPSVNLLKIIDFLNDNR